MTEPVQLTPAQIEEIAEKAAEKAVAKITQNVYAEIGKGVVRKATWIIGMLAVVALLWAQSKGFVGIETPKVKP